MKAKTAPLLTILLIVGAIGLCCGLFFLTSVKETQKAEQLSLWVRDLPHPIGSEIVKIGSSVGPYRAATGNPVDLFGYVILKYDGQLTELQSHYSVWLGRHFESSLESPCLFIWASSKTPSPYETHPLEEIIASIPLDDRETCFIVYSVVYWRDALFG